VPGLRAVFMAAAECFASHFSDSDFYGRIMVVISLRRLSEIEN
jgi:hypothetical protein